MHNRTENEHYEASQGNKFLSAHSTNKIISSSGNQTRQRIESSLLYGSLELISVGKMYGTSEQGLPGNHLNIISCISQLAPWLQSSTFVLFGRKEKLGWRHFTAGFSTYQRRMFTITTTYSLTHIVVVISDDSNVCAKYSNIQNWFIKFHFDFR